MGKEKSAKKVTLIEVLMIILIVGIVVILIFPTITDTQKKKIKSFIMNMPDMPLT